MIINVPLLSFNPKVVLCMCIDIVHIFLPGEPAWKAYMENAGKCCTAPCGGQQSYISPDNSKRTPRWVTIYNSTLNIWTISNVPKANSAHNNLHIHYSLSHSHSQAPVGLGMPRHCPGYFEALCTHITRTEHEDARRALRPAQACLCTYRRTYSVQCSDNTLPQLRIKCGVAKFCPGTHSALQAPMQPL